MSKSQRNTARKSASGLMAAQRSAERRRKVMLVSLAVAILVVFAGGIGFGLYRAQQDATAVTVPASATADGVPVGNPEAPATLDIYLDFQCPVCKQFEELTGKTVDQMVQQGAVRVIYHPIAILDRASSTNYSSRASAASGCAAADGVFPQFARALYAQQPPEGGEGLPDDTMIALGQAAGAKGNFASCVQDHTYAGWTKNVTETASKNGVSGTPTLKLNGREIQDRTPEGLKAAVQAAQPR